METRGKRRRFKSVRVQRRAREETQRERTRKFKRTAEQRVGIEDCLEVGESLLSSRDSRESFDLSAEDVNGTGRSSFNLEELSSGGEDVD